MSITDDDDDENPYVAAPEVPEDKEDDYGGSSIRGMMNIFEDEIIVDKQLSNLSSWVEEVDAEELLDEVQSLLEEMEAL